MPTTPRRANRDRGPSIYVESVPADLHAAIVDESKRQGFVRRVIIITLLREALDARKAAAR